MKRLSQFFLLFFVFFVSFGSAFMLSGCATIPVSKPTILESEKLGIPKGYEFRIDDIKDKAWKRCHLEGKKYCFEFIIRSEPEGVDVYMPDYELGKVYPTPQDIPQRLLGKTPLAIPIYIFKFRNRGEASYPTCLEFGYGFVQTEFDWRSLSNFNVCEANRGVFKNITLKKKGYYDYIIKRGFYNNGRPGSLLGQCSYAFCENVGRELDGKSIEVDCSLVSLPDKFDEELKALIEQKKFKEADDIKRQRVTILKHAIEKDGARDEYIMEIKRLKEMASPIDSETAKLKENLDDAIKAGDYEKANKIKGLIEYKRQGNVKSVDEGIEKKAVQYNKEGMAYAKQEYFKDALESFKKAIEADVAYADAYENISYCYIHLKDFQKAVEYTERAIKLKPDSPYAYFYLGIAYEGLGQPAKAEENYKIALAECAAGEYGEDIIVTIKKRLEYISSSSH